MCGICGAFYFDQQQWVSEAVLNCMNNRMAHRGPDDSGMYCNQNIGLAMRRLSIIDLVTGHQPISNENDSIWIVFNGEIYNHLELKKELLSDGHQYRTNSDTETIIHLYEKYGIDCVQYLDGMFAFVIWDARTRTLFGARDRFGIKPLYYYIDNKKFLFGSEIKSLLAHPGISAILNKRALPEYLAMGYVTGSATLFESIYQLAPGYTIQVDSAGSCTLTQYWELHVNHACDQGSLEVYAQTYVSKLQEAVGSHMLSDVPLGVFLSGGIDSSAIAALATRASQDPISTFSVGYSEIPFSELPNARQVALALGTRHHEVIITRNTFFDSLPALIEIQDEPLAWPSNAALFFVARLAREHVKVVLTGEGSDETLAGYMRYPFTLINYKIDKFYRTLMPAAFRRYLRAFINTTSLLSGDLRRKLQHTSLGLEGDSWESLYFDNFFSAFSATEQADLLVEPGSCSPYEGSMRAWNTSRGNLLQRLLYTDIKTYLVALLMKQDRMSMAASIESRVPFLDHRLVEYALCIPARFNIHGLSGKLVLKNAMKQILPESIISQKKLGFPTPWKYWITSEQFEQIERTLLESRTLSRNLFNPYAVKKMLKEHRSGFRDHTNRIWRLLNFEIWCRVFFDGEEPNRDLVKDPRNIKVRTT